MQTFVRWIAAAVVKVPWFFVIAALIITAGLGALIPFTEEADGVEAFAPDAPELTALTTIGEEFGAPETVIQVVVEDTGGDVITAAGVDAWLSLSNEVHNGAGGAYLADRPDSITGWLDPTLQAMAATGTDPATATDEVVKGLFDASLSAMTPRQAEAFVGTLSSERTDLSVPESEAGLYLAYFDLPTESGSQEELDLVNEIVEGLAGVDVGSMTTYVFSQALLSDQSAVTAQISALFIQAAALILIILFFVYFIRPKGSATWLVAVRRTAADVLLTMSAVLMAVVGILGMQALLGPQFLGLIGDASAMTQVIPVLLIGLGVDFAIHITNRYREELATDLAPVQATRAATLSVGVALALGTLTTAVGFLTNVVNPVPALVDFGILAAIGIVMTFGIMVTFVPSVRLILDRRGERSQTLPRESLAAKGGGVLGKIAMWVMLAARKLAVAVVIVAFLLAGVGAWGMTMLSTEFSTTDFLPSDSPTVVALDVLQSEFGGGAGQTTYILVEGDVASPEVHNATVASIGQVGSVGGVVTYGDVAANDSVISLMGLLLSPSDGGAPMSPEFAQIAAQEGVGPDLTVASDADVVRIYDALFATAPEAAASVLSKSGGSTYAISNVALVTTAVDEEVEVMADGIYEAFAPIGTAGADFIVTSSAIVERLVIDALASSQTSSLLITLGAAMLLMLVTFWIEERRPMIGVITILPVAMVVLWTYGLMALFNIPFGPATATVAALAIGIGIDYSIHVVHRFNEDLARFGDLDEALRSTGMNTGGALVGSSLTTIVGFGILVTSSITPFQQLGALIMIAIGLSVLAAVFVLPAMLVLYTKVKSSQTKSETAAA